MKPHGWRVKAGNELSHYYSDLRQSIFDRVASCNQTSAALEDLRLERTGTRRCELCLAKESSQQALDIIRKAWDTSD